MRKPSEVETIADLEDEGFVESDYLICSHCGTFLMVHERFIVNEFGEELSEQETICPHCGNHDISYDL